VLFLSHLRLRVSRFQGLLPAPWRAMSALQIIASALIAVGFGGLVYLYFLTEAPNWIIVATGLMGCAGLYWLWDEPPD
jgi:hypothetical protein